MSDPVRTETSAELVPEGQARMLLPEPPKPAVDLSVGVASIRPPVDRRYRRIHLEMGLSDVVAVAVGIGVALVFRLSPAGIPVELLLLLAVTPLAVPAVFSMLHLYGTHRLSSAEEFRRLILAVSVVILLMVASPWWPAPAFNRLSIALAWLGALGLVLGTRRVWHRRVRHLRARGTIVSRTLVVGSNREAVRLATGSLTRRDGFEPIGFVGTSAAGRPDDGLPVLGPLGQLQDLIATTAADCVFVASSAVDAEEMRLIFKVARRTGTELRVTATLPEVLSSRLTVQPIGGVIALSLRPVRLTGPQAMLKRTFDIVVSTAILLLSLPTSLVIAAAIKLTSPGPVFYRQERVGRNGRPFTLLKFRTMVRGADRMIDALRERNEADGPLFKIRHDPRITGVGRWLRRWSSDELPQLLNVLKGDMSLVGPRPPLPHEVPAYEEWHFERLEVRPGMTGLWQVSGRSDLSFDEGVRLDLFYVENWSLAYDMFILLKTIPAVVSSRGAY